MLKALTEPDYGSDASALRTTATKVVSTFRSASLFLLNGSVMIFVFVFVFWVSWL